MISIIMPVHNSIDIIAQNVNTLLPMLVGRDEVILVDDKSENGAEIEMLAGRLNVRYIKISPDTSYNRCLALNTGVNLASNQFIIELDQDKVPQTQSYLSSLRRFIEADPSIVYFGHTTHHFPWEIKEKCHIEGGFYTFNAVVGGNVAYKRELFNLVGGYDTIFDGFKGFQDFDLFYRMQCHGARFRFVPDMNCDHVDYHLKSNSMYRRNWDYFKEKHGFIPKVD